VVKVIPAPQLVVVPDI